ncbi:ABC transporter permease [Jeotgalibaca ciconiae]|uniref:ABC transporter permease n=1 Tax=Jeotgalibaca ciconiae TaxID=2496265 RepID=A0A3Q9BLC1_9LACT|nr:ABC transporter permease [Jeotgalibaca ciconiae]AZP05015.1 ABC transporter permease [Jeotgalibaca ciconiae]
MSFEELLSKRRKKYFSKLSRYSKYVFNDHFVIVLFFLLGALAYQYSEVLKTLTSENVLGRFIWVVVLTFALFFGKLMTLAERADQVFLAVKEIQWQQYIKNAKRMSMWLPGVFLLLLTGMAMPILIIAGRGQSLEFVFIAAMLLLLKWFHFGIEELTLRSGTGPIVRILKHGFFLASFLLLLIAFFVHSGISLVGAAVLTIAFDRWLVYSALKEYALLDWEKLIQSEEKRVSKINRLINLFTDVPIVKNKVKRRKYLDRLINRVAGKENPYQYLYTRMFMRGADYLGLFIRLSVIGIAILTFSTISYLSLLINVLFLFITSFQMIPFYYELDENILTQLYPQPITKKRSGFKKLLSQLLGIDSVLLALATMAGSGILTGLAALGLNILFSIFFILFYLDKRTTKQDRFVH